MRSFKAAPEVLSAWMDERKLTAAELSRQTGIDGHICGRSCLFTQCLLRPTRVKLAI